jgi:hypothetical protein
MVVKRSHIDHNIAPAIRVLEEQIDEAYPHRDHRSDGIWPSKAHSKANPNSGHEAGNAIDIDDDLERDGSPDVEIIVRAITESGDRRVKRIVHDGRIWTPERGWRTYHGTNPHRTHAHIEVKEHKRNSTKKWTISAPVRRYPGKLVTKGATGPDVSWIQRRLRLHGIHVEITGVYDSTTYEGVRQFRTKRFRGLQRGGVGPKTWLALAAKPKK